MVVHCSFSVVWLISKKYKALPLDSHQESITICFKTTYLKHKKVAVFLKTQAIVHLNLQTAKVRIIFQIKQEKKRTFNLLSLGPLAFENDIANDFPEILPIGAERMLQIGLKIAPLIVLNLVQRLRHVNIERRQQSWFGLDSKFL